jgi:hypothetical protein
MKSRLNLALAAVLAAASAQAQVTCQVTAINNRPVRVEGTTELLGDLELDCTGGTPATPGQPVPLVNVTLSLNTNVTNRLLGSGYTDFY